MWWRILIRGKRLTDKIHKTDFRTINVMSIIEKSNPKDYVKGNETILYPKWTKEHYTSGIREYDPWEQACKINREAADASASWGMFQIMGFNYAACGEESVESFV